MEVELALTIETVDRGSVARLLSDQGWGPWAYKKEFLPVVLVGLVLYIDFIDLSGAHDLFVCNIVDVLYSTSKKILQVNVMADPGHYVTLDLLREENGWVKTSVFG